MGVGEGEVIGVGGMLVGGEVEDADAVLTVETAVWDCGTGPWD